MGRERRKEGQNREERGMERGRGEEGRGEGRRKCQSCLCNYNIHYTSSMEYLVHTHNY